MLKGNGVWSTAPLPKEATGASIVYAFEGRAAVLHEGEGYSIEDGNIVFVEPPPVGSVICVGDKASVDAMSATDALTRIACVTHQISAMLESARLYEQSTELRLKDAIEQTNALHEDHRKALRGIVDAAGDTFAAGHDKRLRDAAEDLKRELADPLQEMRELTEDAKKAAVVCGEHAESAKAAAENAVNGVMERMEKAVERCDEILSMKIEMQRTQGDALAEITRHRNEAVKNIADAVADEMRRADGIRDELNRSLAVAADRAEQTTAAINAAAAGAGKILEKTRR